MTPARVRDLVVAGVCAALVGPLLGLILGGILVGRRFVDGRDVD